MFTIFSAKIRTAMWVYQTCATISTTPDHCARVVLAAATPAHIQFATRYNTQTTIARSSNNGRHNLNDSKVGWYY